MGRLMVGRIWESGIEDATHLAVLCGIAVFANERTGKCFPSLPRVIKASRRSKNVVREAIKELQKLGYLTVNDFPGKGRNYVVHIDRLPKSEIKSAQGSEENPVQKLTGFKSEPSEGSEVNPEGVQKCTLTGFRSEPQKRKETGKEIGKKQEECVHAQEPLPPPPTDSDLEAMCAQYDGDLFNGAVEPVSEKPRAKTKKIREPLVPLPETLPDDWRALSKERRPEIDPDALLRKMRVRYGPLVKKTMSIWKRTFLNWLARERYYPAPQWQQRRDNRPLQREDMTYTDDF